MNGRIKSLSTGNASGFIAGDDGLNVYFQSSAVLAYDIAGLAVGQLVSFDLEGGKWLRAMNVCVHREHQVPRAPEKHPLSVRLRYMGFEQVGSLRSYRFDRISPGEEKKTFVVTTDLALFLKHHLRIQEGPALCLHLLSEDMGALGPAAWPLLQCQLTDRDILAHLAAQPVPAARRGHKRILPAALAASHSA
jgi:cold shock CspA family protein